MFISSLMERKSLLFHVKANFDAPPSLTASVGFLTSLPINIMNKKTGISKGTILIVDDLPENIHLLAIMLKKQGYKVRKAINGSMALMGVQASHPDLILLDILMPDMNGYEVCQKLKADPATHDIPVIFISALNDTIDKATAFSVGGVDYITKPFQDEEVVMRVKTHLTIHHLQQELQEKNTLLQQEIIERKRIEKELTYLAYHDLLTGLPNRTMFMEHLGKELDHAKENKDYLFAVLFLDLDRFKMVNDSLGHLVGDDVLKIMANRLKKHISSKNIIARLGGDEFTVLLPDIKNTIEARRISDIIQTELSKHINIGEEIVSLTASIGITLGTGRYEQVEELLRDADIAMYGAKTSGRARHKLFEAQQHIHALANMRLESELHQAIESQQFHVYYQPVLSLTDNRIVSVEALIRWQHPQRGLLEPSEFVEIAEETGLIVPINDWVLRTACIQTKTWHDMGYTHLQLSVNVSSRQFEQKHLLKLIQSIFEETALSPHTLILEIVEQTALKNVNMILETMLDLKDMGIQFAVDDFGIGTSIGLLKQLPFDILKIDQSFVRSMNKSDAAIVVAIIAMAHSLQLKIIAEGVETNTQLEFLHSHQCDFIQGYLISQPMPAKSLMKFLDSKAQNIILKK